MSIRIGGRIAIATSMLFPPLAGRSIRQDDLVEELWRAAMRTCAPYLGMVPVGGYTVRILCHLDALGLSESR